ncbi:hypothetical protein [Gordonia sp. VNK21]|uniref:hypothetical protein n=1 Tax=Gordonia sp. VNK21 TaxID=3382483 RepID=UPI0038D460A9
MSKDSKAAGDRDDDLDEQETGDEQDTVDDQDTVDEPDAGEADGAAAGRTPGRLGRTGAVDRKRAARAAVADRDDQPSRGLHLTITWKGLLTTLLSLVLIAALVLLGVGGWKYHQKDQQLAAFDAAKSTATKFTEVYFTEMLSPKADVDAFQAKVAPMTTGKARERVEQDAKQMVSVTKEAGIQNVTVDVTAATVESFDADKATTVVSAKVTGTSPTAPQGGSNVFLLQVGVIKKDGSWLVSEINVMPGMEAQGSGDGAVPDAAQPQPQPGG